MSFQSNQRPTAAIIDLDTLANNFHATKDFVGHHLKYMAVVKGNAYGHGAAACALRLESEGADWFGVAIPEEGVELRRAGLTRPILCFDSFWHGQERLLVKHMLTPVIYDYETAQYLNAYAKERGLVMDVHVKIDTGMRRVGVESRNAAEFARALKANANLQVSGLLSHFASAENPAEDDFTELQIARFSKACDGFRDAGHDPEVIDIANSPGAIAHPGSRGNMVRIGGALYGLLDDILPPATARPKLKPVLSLKSRIAYVKNVARGESIGYGRTFYTERESRIALIPIGYADGYPRALSNLGEASVNGNIVPVVGRISMDWTFLDVTEVPNVKKGDEVVLIGDDVKAADIAQATGTIAYEITCGITARVPRIFE
jgi:alanine racemase